MSTITPQFIKSAAGQVFTLYFPACGETRGALIYLPPFTEEMNRCRALVNSQARGLAASGYAVLLLDYFGTGDSAGELKDATWDIWHADIDAATAWLEHRTGMPPILWGCRLGALLAAEAASRSPGRFNHLLFWQPVIDGKLFLTQFLRLRVAALMDKGLPPETTEQMRARFSAGESVAVSGYELPAALAIAIDQARLADLNLGQARIDWLENIAEPGKPLPPGSQKAINALLAQGTHVNIHPFTAPPIWQLHERDKAPDMIARTSALFSSQQCQSAS